MSILKSLAGFFGSKEESGPPADIRRNDPCWCGSGKKYKKCHLEEDEIRMKKGCSTCGPT